MNLYLDGSWLAPGIGVTGTRRFSAELNDAVVARLAAARAPVASHVFSISAPVEPAFRRAGVRYVTVHAGYRRVLWANALVGRPDVTRYFEPAPDRIHVHDAVRFTGTTTRHAVVTVHDLAALREPATYPARATFLRRRSMRRLRDSAAVVHAVSEATRADVVELAGIRPERVHTIPEGVHPAFFLPLPAQERREHLAELGIDRPFLVHVGGYHRRKNHASLVRAFREVLRRGRDVLLVLIGPGLGAYVDEWCREAGFTTQERARVRDAGPLSDLQLRACLQASLGLAFPSLYEGFGLPVLEAMASGTPVVASSRSSLPEVVGDCGLLCDPYDHDAWIDALDALVTRPALRRDLALRGRARALEFTWTRTAERLLGLLEVPLS